ncbi:MAG: hypothetical protein HY791_11180 [Deltaproteobacteria bacterium]|nr:hypothetical protein [Deltaproteobacteria bacterium]
MEPSDLTIEILKSIRDEIRETNRRVDVMSAGMGSLGGAIEALRTETIERIDALGRRVVEAEIRTATAITDLAGTVQELSRHIRRSSVLDSRVERCERDIDDIKRRLG